MTAQNTPDVRDDYLPVAGTAGTARKDADRRHDWRKSEPVTADARPVWACSRCGLYRYAEPAPHESNDNCTGRLTFHGG